MARKRAKKQPKFTIREVDKLAFKKLNQAGKRLIKHRQEKYKVDVSDLVDVKSSITEFKSRKEFNAWKESMEKLKYRADLQIRNVGGVIASVAQINKSNMDIKRKPQKEWGLKKTGKNTFVSKYGVTFTTATLKQLNLKTIVARDLEIKRKEYIESLPKFNRKGQQIRDTAKDKTGGSVIVREEFNPNSLQTPAKVKIRQESLSEVSDPERYTRREEQLKENTITALRKMLGDDAEDVIAFFDLMDNDEFANFYTMYNRSSMGFDYIYQRGEYSQSEGDMDDRLAGVLESIKTDIGRYETSGNKYKKLIKYK